MMDRTKSGNCIFLMVVLLVTTCSVELANAQFRRLFQNRRLGQLHNQPLAMNSGMATGQMPAWAHQIEVNQKLVDFGVVPRASKQEFTFEFSNPLANHLEVLSANTSCGCTKTEILTPQVGPGEKGRVLARFDTVGFAGDRGASINVRLRDVSTGQIGELQFQVKGQIRQDVVFSPAEINFSNVSPGESVTRLARLYYAGNPNWKIVGVKSTNPNISVKATEIGREPATRKIIYDLEVTLHSDQPAGPLSDQLVIVTNEPDKAEVRVNVLGNVKSSIQATDIALGSIPAGETIQRKLIVRGDHPFEIEAISADDDRLSFTPTTGSRKLHVIPYSVDASAAGELDSLIHIRTKDPEQPELEIRFSAKVVNSPGS